MAAAAKPIVNLARAEIELPLDAATRRLAARAFRDHGYAPALGVPEAREAVARWLSDLGGEPASADEILLTAGGTFAFSLALFALTAPGDRVLVPEPGYANLARGVRALGRDPAAYRVEAATGRLDVAALPSATDARALVFVDPHNPGGGMASETNVRALEAHCAARGMALICDASFAPYGWRAGAPARLRAHGRNLTLGSLGKPLGLADLRLGWIRAEPALIERLANLQWAVSMPPGGPAQRFAAGCLAPGARMSQLREEARRRLDAAMVAAAGEGLSLRAPEGGVTFWIDLRPSGLGQRAAVGAAFDDLGLLVRPGADYGCDGPWIRAGLASDAHATAQAYARLAGLLRRPAAAAARDLGVRS